MTDIHEEHLEQDREDTRRAEAMENMATVCQSCGFEIYQGELRLQCCESDFHAECMIDCEQCKRKGCSGCMHYDNIRFDIPFCKDGDCRERFYESETE